MTSYSKVLMTSSAIVYLLMGLVISFFPQEIGRLFGTASQYGMDLLVMKILGALFFGFGVINLMACRSPLGGVYGRSIVMGNLMLALIIGGQFLKFNISQDVTGGHFWLICGVFIVFATGFLKLFFTSPVQK